MEASPRNRLLLARLLQLPPRFGKFGENLAANLPRACVVFKAEQVLSIVLDKVVILAAVATWQPPVQCALRLLQGIVGKTSAPICFGQFGAEGFDFYASPPLLIFCCFASIQFVYAFFAEILHLLVLERGLAGDTDTASSAGGFVVMAWPPVLRGRRRPARGRSRGCRG